MMAPDLHINGDTVGSNNGDETIIEEYNLDVRYKSIVFRER